MSVNQEEDQKEAQAEEQKVHTQEASESGEDYSFLQETVKDEQVNGKNIWNNVWNTFGKTACRGLVFGLTACLAFCALKPWASAHLSGNQVTIPQDDEEETADQEPDTEEEAGEVVEYPDLTVEDYCEMNRALYQVALTAGKCVAEVRAVHEEDGWENTKFDAVDSVSGVIVWNDGTDILVVAPSRVLKDASRIRISLCDNTEHEAVLKKQDRNLGLAVFAVSRGLLSDSTMSQIQVASLGNSNIVNRGDAVIALGKNFGYSGGTGYGIISSVKHRVAAADGEYRILTTDIPAADKGSGVLFNLNGEVVGIADQTISEKSPLVTAYAISGIKESIELLSNGRGVPYLGIHGVEVTESIFQEKGIPEGLTRSTS